MSQTEPEPVLIIPVGNYTAMMNELRSLRAEHLEIVTACKKICDICHPIREWRGETLEFLLVAESVVNRAKGVA